MAKRILDLAFAGLLFGLSIWFWIVADGFPTSPRYAQIDTDFWPKIVFGTMALITGALFIRSVLSFRASSGGPVRDGQGQPARNWDENIIVAVRVGGMGALILAYYFGFQYLGFVISTLAFLWTASFVLPYRNLIAKLVFAPVFTLVLAVFFTRVLSLPLPRGVGPFYDLSLLLY